MRKNFCSSLRRVASLVLCSAMGVLGFTAVADTYMNPASFSMSGGETWPDITSLGTLTLSWGKQPITFADQSVVPTLTVTPVNKSIPEATYQLKAKLNKMEESGDNTPGFQDADGNGSGSSETSPYLGVNLEAPDMVLILRTPGVYTYTIPAGMVKNASGALNPAQTISYNVIKITEIEPAITPEVPRYNPSFDPSQPGVNVDAWYQGSVNELKTVTLSWDGCPLALTGNDSELIRLRLSNDEMVDLIGSGCVSVADGKVTLDIERYVNGPDTYEVFIKAMALEIKEEEGTTFNQEIIIVYGLNDKNAPNGYIEAPMDVDEPRQAMVASLFSTTLAWGDRNIELCDDAHAELYVNTNPYDYEGLGDLVSDNLEVALTRIGVDGGGISPMADDDPELYNALVVYMPYEALEMKGWFNVLLPVATVRNPDEEVNPQGLVKVLVVSAYEGGIIVSPQVEMDGSANVEGLETIEVSFAPVESALSAPVAISLNEPTEIRLNETVISTEEFMTFGYNDEDGSITSVKFDVSSLVEPTGGEYTLLIPENSFVVDDMYVNPEFYGTYIVTKSENIVKAVEAAGGRYEVFTPGGVRVLSTDDASALSGLAPGLYIVNGTKVLVK